MVAAISPEMMMGGMTVVRGYRSQTTMVRAVSVAYGRIRNQTVETGRWLAPEDETAKQRVAVLGANAASKLFGEIPPEGEEVTINGLRFTVIGVLKTKTQVANYNTPDNECVFIPYETASLYRDLKYPDDIVWMPVNPVFREEALRQVREIMARLHNFSPHDERAVRTVVFNEYIRLVDTMGMALRVLLGFIGTLTLAIGGVGLANIMLVSVTPRHPGAIPAGGGGDRDGGRHHRRGGGLGGDSRAGKPAAAGAAVPPDQRGGRHPSANIDVRGDHLDGVAREHRPDRRIAARHQSRAAGPDRGVAVRIARKGVRRNSADAIPHTVTRPLRGRRFRLPTDFFTLPYRRGSVCSDVPRSAPRPSGSGSWVPEDCHCMSRSSVDRRLGTGRGTSPRRRLFDHWDKLGLNGALIRGYQPEPMDASRSGNCPVGGISQNSQCGDIQGHFIS
jgi:hypothetical protein